MHPVGIEADPRLDCAGVRVTYGIGDGFRSDAQNLFTHVHSDTSRLALDAEKESGGVFAA